MKDKSFTCSEKGMVIVMNINSNYFNFSSSLFSTNKGKDSSSSSNVLGEYMSIKSGAYKKLLKAYYAKQEVEDSSNNGINNDTTTKADFIDAKKDADALAEATNKLLERGTKSVFHKVDKTVTDETTGEVTTTKEYNVDAIMDAVKNYIKAYNSVLDSSSETDNTNILRKATLMTGATSSNKKLLSNIGITIGADNKLSLDEAKFKSASMLEVKDLFQASNSYGRKMFVKASEISQQALQNINKSTTYGVNGKYSTSYMSGMLYDSID